MTGAYVLINCRAGRTGDVVRALRRQGIREVRAVAGLYDVVAFVTARSADALGETVVRRIQTVDGVERTVTMVAVKM